MSTDYHSIKKDKCCSVDLVTFIWVNINNNLYIRTDGGARMSSIDWKSMSGGVGVKQSLAEKHPWG